MSSNSPFSTINLSLIYPSYQRLLAQKQLLIQSIVELRTLLETLAEAPTVMKDENLNGAVVADDSITFSDSTGFVLSEDEFNIIKNEVILHSFPIGD